MTEEIRLECLRLAVASAPHGKFIETARQYLAFVDPASPVEKALVAQRIEHQISNLAVAGSNPAEGSTPLTSSEANPNGSPP